MKATLFCLLNFFICFFAQGQTYHSFMHDTAIWQEYDAGFCCDPGSGAFDSWEINYVEMSDTIINGFSYKKLFAETISHLTNQPLCDNFPWTYGVLSLIGFIREDSFKKVYFLPGFPGSSLSCSVETIDSEKILYDFGLQIGDTVYWKPFNNVVIAIDSIQAPNDEFIEQIIFDGDYWTEGLGSNLGLFGSYMEVPFECGSQAGCAQATDLLPPNSLPPCGGIVNAVHELHIERQLQIFPNPFSDFVSLTSPFQSSSLLYVLNSQGQIILKKRLQPFEKIPFTKNELPADDFIFFHLISDAGASQSGMAVHVN
jgi:hypothetical protein